MKLIQTKQSDGRAISFNADHIIAVHETFRTGVGCLIETRDGKMFDVKESYREVTEKLKEN